MVLLRTSTLAAVLVLTPPTSADEVRLADGRVLVGAVHRKGDVVEITTRDGVVDVRADEIVDVRTDQELRAALRALAKGRRDSAFSQLQLAQTAYGFGLSKEMWRHLDLALAKLDEERTRDGEPGAAERLLGKFLTTLEPEILSPDQRQRETDKRVRKMLYQVRAGAPRSKRAAILELLVVEKDADAALRKLSRRGLLPEQRTTALAALMRRPAEHNETFVYRSTILDKDREVRREAAALIARSGDEEAAVRYLAPGFLHDSPEIRIRTAEAYAAIGSRAAVPILVAAGPIAGTPARAAGGYPGVRAHMSDLTQRAYIRDFDVEIAQAAAVANPQVGNLQSGVVLDATVAAVVSQRVRIESAYRRALRALASEDPGRDPRDWQRWLDRLDPELASVARGR